MNKSKMNRDLDNLTTIKAIDKSNMLNLLLDFPNQCKRAQDIGEDFVVPEHYHNFHNIVFSGLGGSAIGGDTIRSYLKGEIQIPIMVNRTYSVPAFVNEQSLVFVSSYSGNTEETISAYKAAREKNAKIVVITSGGSLLELSRDDGIPCVVIPKGLPPRTALGYLALPSLMILSKMGLIANKSDHIAEAVELLATLKNQSVGPTIKTSENTAKELALSFHNRFIVIYGSCDYVDVAVSRWRAELAENAKTLASDHFFPELTHNEIVGWEYPSFLPKSFMVVVLRDIADHKRIQRRMDITKSIIENEGIPVREVWSIGEGLLSRIFSLVYIGDFVSFYLAVLNDVDPTPVKRIDYLKEQLRKNDH